MAWEWLANNCNTDDHDDKDDNKDDDDDDDDSRHGHKNRAVGMDWYDNFYIDQLEKLKEGPNNDWYANWKNGLPAMVKVVTKSGKTYWMSEAFFKKVAHALERESNWFYHKKDGAIEIISENHDYDYDELKEAVIKMYFGQVVCGDDIVRITEDNFLKISFKESSIRLSTKDHSVLLCDDTPYSHRCPANAHITGVIPNELRVYRYRSDRNKKDSIYLHKKRKIMNLLQFIGRRILTKL